jgi:PAS domain S-box-containing protein
VNHRVVLVDDVPEIRQILRLILEHAGPFEVVGEGSNGHEAVTLAAELRPDLLVMDVEMRGGPNGWEALVGIRDAAPETAVVILSGSAADPFQAEREVMADAVLEKGMSPQDLNEALLAILGDPSTRRRGATPALAARAAGAPSTDHALLLTSLLEVTSDAVIELDDAGLIRSWNAAAEGLYGRTQADTLGSPITELCAPGAAREVEQLVERAARGERIAAERVLQIDAVGSTIVACLSIVPVGRALLVVARDVSAGDASDHALAWAVSKLDAQNREVERATQELQSFASVASHDLAQPLQVAYGYLEMVRSEFGDGMDPTAASWIDAAVGSLERMRMLVQDILTYARSGNRELPAGPVDVDECARNALAAIESLVTDRGADVRLASPLPVVEGDEAQVTLVLEHVLENAVTFVPQGTVPVVEVSADEQPTEWIVSVVDNGPGIPAELQDRVFDLFYRGSRSKSNGSGLGLSVCRKLLVRMGGRIWVDPTPDGSTGARLHFALPKNHLTSSG